MASLLAWLERALALCAVLALSAACGRSGLGAPVDGGVGRAQSDLDAVVSDLAFVREEALVRPDAPVQPNDGPVAILCGNGVLDPGEDCEDGNRVPGDGCDPSCHHEFSILDKCGNGILDVELGEACDDGNRQSGDGCSDQCCAEGCWVCSRGCLDPPRCRCGNGMLEWGEDCDDGNRRSGDGCSQRCEYESPTCGNGVLELHEQCDDGNRVGDDGCGPDCRYDPPEIVCRLSASVCSDGKVTGPETCDDGNVLSGDGCSRACTIEPGFFCANPGKPCRAIPPSCGDGRVGQGEACDDGVNDGRYDGCNPDCTLGPRCGDGIVQPLEDEECDDGPANGHGGCSEHCRMWIL